MVLDNTTFDRVIALFPKMPYNTAQYCGCWQKGMVSFQVGTANKDGVIIAGLQVTINEDFKILRTERMTTIWGGYTRNMPTVEEKIPLHPAGTIPSIYKN